MRYIHFFIFHILAVIALAQEEPQDSILLSDIRIQFECTEAIHAMYNFEYDKAEQQFTWLEQQYPEHPLPYFLKGLNIWWKILPNDENLSYDEEFFKYMDVAIEKAENMKGKKDFNPEADFFLAASYGFKARLFSDRGNYAKAAFAAKKSLNHMETGEVETELSPEFKFGIALYNYFREWIPENKPFLKPIVMFFRKGDKELGLKQLDEVGEKAFYTRIEAMHFLMKIYADYEDKKDEAIPYARYLHSTFPNNSYFHRAYAKLLFRKGDMLNAKTQCQEIMQKVGADMPGYGPETARHATYFLGFIAYKYDDDDLSAKAFFNACVKYGKQVNAFEKNYYLYSHRYLAEIALKEGNKEEAILHYLEVMENADKDNKAYKQAKKYIKENKIKKRHYR